MFAQAFWDSIVVFFEGKDIDQVNTAYHSRGEVPGGEGWEIFSNACVVLHVCFFKGFDIF